MGRTKVLLVRHGQTIDNVNQILQGQTGGRLTDEGISQARRVSKHLSETHIDEFFASDLQRAVVTCEIIAEPHHKNIKTSTLLRERDWGDFTGRFIPEIKDSIWPENVETLENIKSRVATFIEMLQREYEDKTVLIVGHGIVNKAFQSVVFGKEMNEIEKMSNAEMRILYV